MTLPINFQCPECGSEIEFYNTSDDEKSGRYKCKKCGRDTIWKEIKTASVNDIFRMINKKGNVYGKS